jgi:hypothetical protein
MLNVWPGFEVVRIDHTFQMVDLFSLEKNMLVMFPNQDLIFRCVQIKVQKDSETERQRDRETERQQESKTKRQKDRTTERQNDSKTERQKDNYIIQSKPG